MKKAEALVDGRWSALSGGTARRWQSEDHSWCTGAYGRSWSKAVRGFKGHK